MTLNRADGPGTLLQSSALAKEVTQNHHAALQQIPQCGYAQIA